MFAVEKMTEEMRSSISPKKPSFTVSMRVIFSSTMR